MLARVTAFAIDGLTPRRVVVEVDLRPGLPGFTIVGRGDAAVRESRERVHSAVANSGFGWPQRRITVNLAPAQLRKQGVGFDLATACGILVAAGLVPPDRLDRWAVFGELSLSGEVRPCPGALAVAEGVRREGIAGLVVPRACAPEAALVDEIAVAGVGSLRELAAILAGERPDTPPAAGPGQAPAGAPDAEHDVDLADVRGHETPLAAMTIAAAGGHNLLFTGPPGTGKTMLARRLPTILPPLTRAEALEVTRIHSVAGRHLPGSGLLAHRPFRAPHHSISPSGLVGGGAVPVPGEASLAHHGVLFLDELSEFPRSALEALRQPLEDGRVTVVRGQRTAVFPTRFTLVASTNPCPCGHAGDPRCRCTEGEVERYRRRLSGPLLDRMDLLVTVRRPGGAHLAAPALARSAEVRARVTAARARQLARLQGTGVSCNAQMPPRLLRERLDLRADARDVLRRAYEKGELSARGHDRVLRVARTVADLDDADTIERAHAMQALQYRQRLDRSVEGAA